MALDTYANLKASLADWIARADLTAQIADFVALCEARVNRELRVRQMEVTGPNISTVAGQRTIPLPADFIEPRAFQIADTTNTPITGMALDQFSTTYAGNGQGRPTHYAIVGANLYLGPIPDAVYAVQPFYYGKIPALSDSNTTNWLLTNYPNVYLYGSLIEAEPFMKNDLRIATWLGLYDRAIAAIKGENARAVWNGAPLRPAIDISIGSGFNIATG
ncbi:MAG: hypothetical protein J0H39_13960 [Alphaproteobacteria bacterium]|nr:hypothetical protein [Alphaproteobacteria bacterium]